MIPANDRAMPRAFLWSLWFGRVAAPIAAVLCVAAAVLAVASKMMLFVFLDCALAAACVVLTCFNWFVLQPQWPGKRRIK